MIDIELALSLLALNPDSKTSKELSESMAASLPKVILLFWVALSSAGTDERVLFWR